MVVIYLKFVSSIVGTFVTTRKTLICYVFSVKVYYVNFDTD